ncbi:MAG: hypothetical protein COB98_11730, partial [Flavobacteriaceae bacterium]
DIDDGVILEIILRANNYDTNLHPKASCTSNNHQNLDSDGDECSDAFEAGITTDKTLNYSFVSVAGEVTDSNSDGLADAVNTNGVLNYYFASSATLNLCTDFDNDGVGDLIDIDDDNDGILDAVESPDCYYTKNELHELTITGTDLIWHSGYPLSNSIDINNGSFTQTRPISQDLTNKTIVEYSLASFVQIENLTLKVSYLSLYATSGTFELQGFDGTVWVSLSAATIDNRTGTHELVLSNTLAPNTTFSKLRIYGVQGKDNRFRLYNAAVNLINVIPSQHPKGICLQDNHQNLDSDGDGCSDAFEAGTTTDKTADFTFVSLAGTATDVNSDGLADAVDTSIVLNYPLAISSVLKRCSDMDNDGVGAIEDIDDDNDGILDAVESPTCYYTEREAKKIVKSYTELQVDDPLALLHDNLWTAAFNFKDNRPIAGKVIYGFETASNFELASLVFDHNNTSSMFEGAEQALLQAFNGYYWVDLTEVLTFNATALNREELFVVTKNTAEYRQYRVLGVAGDIDDGIILEIILNANNYNSNLHPNESCTSNNHQNLDSDSDGCSDAFEAGTTLDKTLNYSFVSVAGEVTDANGDGLADAVNTNAVLNYQFARSAALNLCTDFDNDGVGDLIDIDDDNDGVLDAIESPDCYYTADELSLLTITGTDLIWHSGYPLSNSIDVNTGSLTQTNPINQALAGKTIVEYSLASFVHIENLTLKASYLSLSKISGTFELQGFDGTVWVSLSVAIIDNITTIHEVVLSNTLAPNTSFSKLRIYGIQGKDNRFRLYNVAVNLLNVIPSQHPKAICLQDNHQNLDSDGDDCSDAYESGNTSDKTVNYTFPSIAGTATDVNSDGLADALDANLDGIPDTIQTYYVALGANLNACLDFDNDGVGDLLDIDDDNDGILDHIESPNCFYTQSEHLSLSGDRRSLEGFSVSTELINTAGYLIEESIDGIENAANNMRFKNSQSLTGVVAYQVNLPYPLELSAIYLKYSSTYGSFNKGYLKLQGSVDNVNWTDLNDGTVAHISNPPGGTYKDEFLVDINAEKYQYYRLFGISGTSYSNGQAELLLSLATNYQASEYPKSSCSDDADGDLIYNHLDLDSDGDNCSDALESGTTTDRADDYSFTTVAGETTDSNSDGLADELDIDLDGVPDAVQTYNHALEKLINACTDTDNDGIVDLVDLDDDNDGILDSLENCPDGTNSNPLKSLAQAKDMPTGRYYFDFGQGVFQADVDASNGGGWMLITQYVHKSGTNPALNIITVGSDFPINSGSAFGVDDSLDSTKWGHTGNAALNQIGDIDEIRFYGITSNHSRTLHFKTASTNAIDYIRTGTGSMTGIQSDHVKFADNTAYLPTSINSYFSNQNDQALTNFPFYRSGAYHWGIKGLNSRWEVDNYTSVNTIHKVWVRGTGDFICNQDIDNDGIINSLDLDSDNDGCPDAIEGGGVFTKRDIDGEGRLSGLVDSNGIPVVATSSGQTIGTSVDAVQIACFLEDTDSDGIYDFEDLDDDNDGILDTEETVPTLLTGGTATQSSNYISGGAASLAINGDTNGVYGSGSVTHTSSSSIDPWWLLDLKDGSHFITEVSLWNRTDCCLERLDNFILEVLDTSSTVVYTYKHGAVGTTQKIVIPDINVQGSFVRIRLLGGGVLSLAEVKVKVAQDTDNDGIPNHLDLDSDGDGCPDAVEGTGTFTLLDLVDSTLNGGNTSNGGTYTGTSTDVVITNLGDTVDMDSNSATYGVPIVNPNVVAVSQLIGDSQNSAVQSQDCDPCTSEAGVNGIPTLSDSDGDGINDFCDLDDDNDGILDAEEMRLCDLQATLDNLNAGHTNITALIPNKYDFIDGVTGDYITDGGDDMFDNANYMSTNMSASNIEYSDNTIAANSAVLGASGTYFTRKYPGLFVFSGIIDGATSFSLSGDNGADGNGVVDGQSFTYTNNGINYYGFVKRIYNTTDPSINHLIIIENQSGLTSSFPSNTNIGEFIINNLTGTSVVHHLLYASGSGGFIDDVTTQRIMKSYINTIGCSTDIDTDNDGIPNHLDLDSDDDGCPDAVEARIKKTFLSDATFPDGSSGALTNFTNGQVTGEYGANGLANAIEDNDTNSATLTAESYVITGTNSYTDYALFPAINICTDTDGDGVADFFDLDDDNDGILDTEEGQPCDLQTTLDKLNVGYANITALIPNKYDFSDGVIGNNINDGGNDMFDGANYMSTNMSTSKIVYSDNTIATNSAVLGVSGSYFTRKYPGLFVFSGILDGATSFNLSGENGADGGGAVSGQTFTYTSNGVYYVGFVKRIYNASDPSVNHLIIIKNQSGLVSSFPSDTDNGEFIISNLTGTSVVHHLLYASDSGGFIDDVTTQRIMESYINTVGCSTDTDEDTDSDGVPNRLDLDSDGDGCTDADEAYADLNADADDTGIFGEDIPTLTNGLVNANGLVISAGIVGTGDAYINEIATTSEGENTFKQASLVTVDTVADQLMQIIGADVTFTAANAVATLSPVTSPLTTANTTVTYQWQLSTDDGLTFVDIPSETNANLVLSAIDFSLNDNQYKVLVQNEANLCGAESTALLTLVPCELAGVLTAVPTNELTCIPAVDATITIAGGGMINSTEYIVTYIKDGGAVSTVAPNLTTSVTGDILITTLGAGVYTNITVTSITDNTCEISVIGDVTINAFVNNTDFTVTNPSQVCKPNTVDITALEVATATTGNTLTYWSDATATTTSLTTATAVVNTGTYYIKVTNVTSGCVTIKPVEVIINDLPEITITPVVDLCIDASAVTLAATPLLGTFAGTGVTGTSFDPAIAGAGTHIITYSFTDGNGCANSDTIAIIVNPLPVIAITSVSALCIDTSAVTLAATPLLGIFTGTGVTGTSFDPATAGAGTHIITYSFT